MVLFPTRQASQHPAPYARPMYHYPGHHAYQSHPGSLSYPPDAVIPEGVRLRVVPGSNNKRLAPPHPSESPAKKKQSKWTADEDAAIIELRGNGMKWEDISKHLPGRSAISCRLRFQNYLERRAEWDEEKKNKLARLYERFKKDMWEKISKEMQLPWRAAEAMHWQIGEVEMAQRANVPVFHLASNQQASQHLRSSCGYDTDARSGSRTPPSATADYRPFPFAQTHNHGLPHSAYVHGQPVSPVSMRLRSNSNDSSTGSGRDGPCGGDSVYSLRRRADSARSVPPVTSAAAPMGRAFLPSVGELTSRHHVMSPRITLPPVSTISDHRR